MMKHFPAFLTNILLKFRPKPPKQDVLKTAKEFARRIDYSFKDYALLIHALKHRSYLSVSNESRLHSNERLELLGDAVLGLIVTDYLYHKYPKRAEGELTTIKSLIVSREILARTAKNIRLGDYILMNEAEEKSGGRERASILADALEAIICSIYIDGGLQPARRFIKRALLKDLNHILSEEKHKNFKSILLEYSQSRNFGLPFYVVKHEEGPDHNKIFTVEVRIQNEILGHGKGSSKKSAEQHAAHKALKKLLVI